MRRLRFSDREYESTCDRLTAASQKTVSEAAAPELKEIDGIMERAVKRGSQGRNAQPVPLLGGGEKEF